MSETAPVTEIEEAPEVLISSADVKALPKLVRLVEEWHEGTGLQLPAFDSAWVLRWLLDLHDGDNGFLAYAELQGGRYSRVLAGLIGVGITRPMWSPEPMAFSHVFHVVPAHRRWGVGQALVDAAKAWAAHQRCPLALNLVQGKKVGARPDHYYQLSGASLVGGVFMYGLSVGESEE